MAVGAPRKRTNRADVMISSTSADLTEHRDNVRDAIWRAGMYPLAMERDEAVPDSDAIKFSLDMVDEAEVYLGIFGFRYGYAPKDPRNPDKVSVTELEYRRAVERGIPMLIFVMHDDHPIKAKDKETGIAQKKLDKLKKEIKRLHIVSFFKSVEDLREKVTKSLYDLKVKQLVDTSPDEGEKEAEAEKSDSPKPPFRSRPNSMPCRPTSSPAAVALLAASPNSPSLTNGSPATTPSWSGKPSAAWAKAP